MVVVVVVAMGVVVAEEKDWRFGCFFFPTVDLWWLWLWLMVELVVVGFFFGSGIYYSIVMVIIFYCDVYIILLC